MFTKINVSGITITSTLTNGETTTMKIDSINFEDNCSATEAIKVLEALPKILCKQKKIKEEQKKQINAFNQEFLITVFSFKMSSALRKQGQKYAIIKDIRTNEFFTLSKDGLSRHHNNPYFYNLYEKKIENGDCIQQRKFYSDYIPAYEEL